VIDLGMTTFSIVQAHQSDARAMVCIEQSAGELFRTFPGLEWLADSPDRKASFYYALISGGWCWVAVNGESQPKGFLAAELIGFELHICEIAVIRDLQRRGIGRSLMQAATAKAEMCELEGVTLTTFRDVPWNAPAYERFGFRQVQPQHLSPRHKRLFCAESAAGLDVGSRCAMRLDLGSRPRRNKFRPQPV
jgi:ribosomal protein S18 acetylase RimI-like enzyme